MHPRSPFFHADPDFAKLGRKYDALAKYVKGNSIDFQCPDAIRALNTALLLEHFNLDVILVRDRLCPIVPNRLNYALWIEDLVAETCDVEVIRGIDVGTGASAIYPLLLCRRNTSYEMLALEADELSLAHAINNVNRNDLSTRITCLRSDLEDHRLLTQHDSISSGSFQFTMCNPPFYSSIDDIETSLNMKTYAAEGHCEGAECEMITEGGEVEFTMKLLQESLVLLEKIQWYTTMLGKLSSLQAVVNILRERQISNYAITELIQSKTRRWVVAWSFQPARPSSKTARGCTSVVTRSLLPTNPAYVLQSGTMDDVLLSKLDDLSIDWRWKRAREQLRIEINADTWTRAARRRPEIKFIAKRMMVDVTKREDGQIELTWVSGDDDKLWESFCGKMKQLLRE